MILKARMPEQAAQIILETFKEEGIDLYVTMPEEPTTTLTEAVARDPFFQSVIVTGESHGIALCAGAATGDEPESLEGW